MKLPTTDPPPNSSETPNLAVQSSILFMVLRPSFGLSAINCMAVYVPASFANACCSAPNERGKGVAHSARLTPCHSRPVYIRQLIDSGATSVSQNEAKIEHNAGCRFKYNALLDRLKTGRGDTQFVFARLKIGKGVASVCRRLRFAVELLVLTMENHNCFWLRGSDVVTNGSADFRSVRPRERQPY